MPWGAKTVESIREDFINKVMLGEASKSALCREFNISRPTGDKWITRYKNGESLSDRSRRPFGSPNKTLAETEEKILSLRSEHPSWGARKIIRVLENCGECGLPAQSTVCDILKRNGCVEPFSSLAAKPLKRFEKDAPNKLWQMDFKGHFQMLDGKRCHPLTILDDHSRFSLCVDALPNEQLPGVLESLIRLFEQYGLPDTLLCDNGNPWGASQSTGYTRFETIMMDLDILTIHGRPRHPQTQGKDERFNRTLATEAITGQKINDLNMAQRIFNDFRDCYNNIRPHGALGLDCPAAHYTKSTRRLPQSVTEWEYPFGAELRKVKSSGYVTYKNQGYFLSEAFGGKTVAIIESSKPGCVNLCYRNFRIARLDIYERTFVSRKIYRLEDE